MISEGWGLTQLEIVIKTATVELNSCSEQTDDPLLKLVNRQKSSKKLYSVSKDASKFKKELDLPDQPRIQQEPVCIYLQYICKESKKADDEECTGAGETEIRRKGDTWSVPN